MRPDIILCNIIAEEMGLDANRVVVYSQNFKAPKDDNIYVIVSTGTTRIIGNNNRFVPADPDANPPTLNREIKTVARSTTYNVEITSRNTDAKYRNHEILTAIRSTYSEQQQEENEIRIFRTGQITDLTFIEGRSSLHRYQIPVIINSVSREEKVIDVYDRFEEPQTLVEPK